MYDPKGIGIRKNFRSLSFIEADPPAHLKHYVHKFVELKTITPLERDYIFHALPDACTYAIFDQYDLTVAGITRLHTMSDEFNLGKSFCYLNIRFLPGVWQDGSEKSAFGLIDGHYTGKLPLLEINQRLASVADFGSKLQILTEFTESLKLAGYLVRNAVTKYIFDHLDEINSVSEMAKATGLSVRQLQRRLNSTTGFAPHDLLKILRLQKALRHNDCSSYSDQSHFIHSFRRATGYTPGRYAREFDMT